LIHPPSAAPSDWEGTASFSKERYKEDVRCPDRDNTSAYPDVYFLARVGAARTNSLTVLSKRPPAGHLPRTITANRISRGSAYRTCEGYRGSRTGGPLQGWNTGKPPAKPARASGA